MRSRPLGAESEAMGGGLADGRPRRVTGQRRPVPLDAGCHDDGIEHREVPVAVLGPQPPCSVGGGVVDRMGDDSETVELSGGGGGGG